MPSDADIIEFNEFPDDSYYTKSHGSTAVRHVFLTSKWAIGGSGRFYIIEPSVRHPNNFYVGKLRVSPFELFTTIAGIDKDLLVRSFDVGTTFQRETHMTWPQPKPDYKMIPPPPTWLKPIAGTIQKGLINDT